MAARTVAQRRSNGARFALANAEGRKRIHVFSTARSSLVPRERLEAVRSAARRFHKDLMAGPEVAYYRSFDLVRVPYPTKYGLLNAFHKPVPYLHILNRLFVIQFKVGRKLKTLLFSPSDLEGNIETPFFKRLSTMMGPLSPVTNKIIAPIVRTVEEALGLCGLRPEDVDYISYDHLHTQELRKWLGSYETPAFFPNAKLLVMRQEWESASGGLLPPQADWYCPDGCLGVDPRKVVLLDHDTMLGDGVALIRTPGHTEGNHSLVVRTPMGVLVTSENGISADSYSPRHSRLRSVRRYAEKTGMEVILNGNTLEGGLDQYISMVQEKEMAGPSLEHPNFFNVVPSSEMTPYWAFPGTRSTFRFGELEFGAIA